MKCFKVCLTAVLCLLLSGPLLALKTDRQEPLDVKADSTGGTLGDGTATLQGNVEIRQGSLWVRADVADVSKIEGRVQHIALSGQPVRLQQEIENEGLVTAEAAQIEYEVATGIVTLTGAADVNHPQYQISGEKLVYDMNLQHFQGQGGGENGRIQIRLDPELLENAGSADPEAEAPASDEPDEEDPDQEDPGEEEPG